uniref:Uncharacterized protein n=1 Tax=Lygus hesperus TaxID=30085 RepID=A0A0A9Y5C4_LYGHE
MNGFKSTNNSSSSTQSFAQPVQRVRRRDYGNDVFAAYKVFTPPTPMTNSSSKHTSVLRNTLHKKVRGKLVNSVDYCQSREHDSDEVEVKENNELNEEEEEQ